MESLSYWTKLVEAEDGAIDTFVFDRAEESFHAAFDEWRGDFHSSIRLVRALQADLQKIMADLVKLHGNWLQRHLHKLPQVLIRMDAADLEIGGETGLRDKTVTIHLSYSFLKAILESDEVFDEACQIFAGIVVHEFVHVVQLLKKTFSQDQYRAPGASGRRGDFSTAKGDGYLAAPHEMEAYAHTVAFDLIRVLRKVPETMQVAMMNAILGNRNLIAAKSRSYERYIDNASDNTINALDDMVDRLVRKHFAIVEGR